MDKTTEILAEQEETKVEASHVVLTPEEESRMKAMMDANVFYGHTKSRTNPKMRSSILVTKSGVEVIDLMATAKAIDSVARVVKGKVASGGTILFVGTTPAAKTTIKEVAARLGMPYVDERWLGGTLTNFKTISTRITHFKQLESDKLSGNLQKYTKKERLEIDRDLARFEKLLRGISTLEKMPALVFVADLGANEIAAREARKMKIPSIALVNTNQNPDVVNYPIPANDRHSGSVAYIVGEIEKIVLEGKKEQKAMEDAKVVNK